MGLLTNANSSQGPLPTMLAKLIAKAQLLSWLMYLIGVFFIFLMPHPEYSHKTYFSENALLPGLVRLEFDIEHIAKQYLEDLRDEAKKTPSSPPFPWIEARLRQMGLEVYRHNFSLKFPLGARETYHGDNIYAILRAPRASSTESLVLTTPYRPPVSVEAPTDVSVAMLLTMAKFFRHKKFWAKDIIFIITQHEQLGMQAWLEAYHKISCGYGHKVLDHGDLEARAGSIQAAINLEITHESFTHLNVKVEGLNGQLPNLDLVTLVNRLAAKEGLPSMFQGMEDASHPENWNGYWKSFRTFISMAAKQAAGGIPSGNHGLFHRFGIEAVTIESVHKLTKRSRRRDFNLFTAGRILEGIYRSLNNLLERFHQSFFFYLLPGTSRYVSIGMYMPAFGFLAGGMLLMALKLWTDDSSAQNEVKNDSEDKENKNKSEAENKIKLWVRNPDLGNLIPGWILCHMFSVLVVILPGAFSKIGAQIFKLETDDAISIGILAYSLIGASMVFKQREAFGQNWNLVKCLGLLEISALVFSMSLCNFSLAYLITLIYVPVALITSPNGNRLVKFFKRSVIILIHPLCLLFIFCMIDTIRAFPEKSVLQKLSASISASKQAIMFSISDWYIYGNYAFAVATVCLMPCWLILWHVVNSQKTENIQENTDTLTLESKKDQ